MARLGLASTLCALLIAGCTAGAGMQPGDLAGSNSGIPDGGRCAPATTQSCMCLGGGSGTQVCRASGSSFGACAGCASPSDAGLPSFDLAGGGQCGSCAGCCDGTTCVPFASQTNAQCGQRGLACQACTGTNVCVVGSGTCANGAAGCGSCGNGCCKNTGGADGGTGTSVCLQDEPSACGTACTACNYGVTCASGTCSTTLDGNALFSVYVQTAVVAVNGTCPDNWDDFSEPDPQVYMGYQSAGNFIEGYTNYASNTLSATYDDTTGLIADGSGNPVLIPASAFIAGTVRITLNDNDSPLGPDQIGQGYIPATSTYMATYSTGAFGCAMNVTFQLR